jgi:hypothetical protein
MLLQLSLRFQGHAFGAPGRPASGEVQTREHERIKGLRDAVYGHTPSRARSRAARRLRSGWPAAPSRAEALGARRRRQVSRPAPAGSQFPPQRAPDDRDRTNLPGRPPRAGHSLAAQRSQARSYVLASLRALHLASDLPRQDPAPIGRTEQSGLVPLLSTA